MEVGTFIVDSRNNIWIVIDRESCDDDEIIVVDPRWDNQTTFK